MESVNNLILTGDINEHRGPFNENLSGKFESSSNTCVLALK